MRTLGSMIALVALTASAPAFASDVSSDRYFKQASAATVRSTEARPSAPEEDERPCTCSCARRMSDERPTASRVEPGGH